MRGEEWDAQASAWIQTRYMFWGMRLAASYIENGGGSDLRTYGYTGGADSEAFVRVELSNHDGDYELARDFQGTILALIDRGTGAVVERYRYTPWGEVSIEDASGTPQSASQYGNRRLFMGRLWDAEIGIYDVRARWYEPDRGAFAGPDPLGAVDSWNLYQYGFGTPGTWLDSTGESGIPVALWLYRAYKAYRAYRTTESLLNASQATSQLPVNIDPVPPLSVPNTGEGMEGSVFEGMSPEDLGPPLPPLVPPLSKVPWDWDRTMPWGPGIRSLLVTGYFTPGELLGEPSCDNPYNRKKNKHNTRLPGGRKTGEGIIEVAGEQGGKVGTTEDGMPTVETADGGRITLTPSDSSESGHALEVEHPDGTKERVHLDE